ncbi:hypothetical protein CC86DRAFT_387141 [Ophiobolus disseminans]|uniref:RING-type domain-containing protein n=1 Tax=Ophiobolus disseminans TaxID=1469910 RepID=A0A6A6ZHS3_9PLEO|nr:hypothetical protein CC86DRAFT_387141 [Ophiobolus disseminans]
MSAIPTTTTTTTTTTTPIPSRLQFIANSLEASSAHPDTTCSICIELNCWFHRACILEWFASAHERRGTCPNDRTVLFEAADTTSAADELMIETASERFNSALQRHVEFVREQNALTATGDIAAAWCTATDSDVVDRVQYGIFEMRMNSALFSRDQRDHYDPVFENAAADFDRLGASFAAAARLQVSTWLSELRPVIEALERSSFNQMLLGWHKVSLLDACGQAETSRWYMLHHVVDEMARHRRAVQRLHADMVSEHRVRLN